MVTSEDWNLCKLVQLCFVPLHNWVFPFSLFTCTTHIALIFKRVELGHLPHNGFVHTFKSNDLQCYILGPACVYTPVTAVIPQSLCSWPHHEHFIWLAGFPMWGVFWRRPKGMHFVMSSGTGVTLVEKVLGGAALTRHNPLLRVLWPSFRVVRPVCCQSCCAF